MQASNSLAVEWTSVTVPSEQISTKDAQRSLLSSTNRRVGSKFSSPISIDHAAWISYHFNGLLAHASQPRSLMIFFRREGGESRELRSLSMIRPYLTPRSVNAFFEITLLTLVQILWVGFLVAAHVQARVLLIVERDSTTPSEHTRTSLSALSVQSLERRIAYLEL